LKFDILDSRSPKLDRQIKIAAFSFSASVSDATATEKGERVV
jgi:hypothetical protein